MLTGIKFPKYMHALRLVVEELSRTIFQTEDFNSYRDGDLSVSMMIH